MRADERGMKAQSDDFGKRSVVGPVFSSMSGNCATPKCIADPGQSDFLSVGPELFSRTIVTPGAPRMRAWSCDKTAKQAR